jgi:hypothetical protein
MVRETLFCAECTRPAGVKSQRIGRCVYCVEPFLPRVPLPRARVVSGGSSGSANLRGKTK